MMYLTIFMFLIYVLLIAAFIIGFDIVKTFKPDFKKNNINSFSIIIPFRNESENLPELLESLLKLNYPSELVEILFINDNSTDNSVEIIEQLMTQKVKYNIIDNIRKSNAPKKDAIETAISISKYDWIVTTDADCIVPKNWLKLFDDFIGNKKSKMICAPVTYLTNNTFLQNFQLLDFVSLIGSTIGGFGIGKPFLCNGANLCYSKEAFMKVNGFEGNNSISSGDDIFLLEKMASNFGNQVHFLKSKEALVYTKPQRNLQNLFSQRVRWASKSKFYQNWFGKFVGIVILFTNLILLLMLFLALLKLFSWKNTWLIFGVKISIDLILIFKTLHFTNQQKKIIYYPFVSLIHPIFIIFTAFLSFFYKQFDWKGRKSKI